jgi:hypothetical protein
MRSMVAGPVASVRWPKAVAYLSPFGSSLSRTPNPKADRADPQD